MSIDTVIQWVKFASVFTAILTTAFPLIYLFSPWYRSQLGRAVMLQSVSIAFAIDITVVYQHWRFTTDLRTLMLINIGLLLFISAGTLYLIIMLLVYNFANHKENQNV